MIFVPHLFVCIFKTTKNTIGDLPHFIPTQTNFCYACKIHDYTSLYSTSIHVRHNKEKYTFCAIIITTTTCKTKASNVIQNKHVPSLTNNVLEQWNDMVTDIIIHFYYTLEYISV